MDLYSDVFTTKGELDSLAKTATEPDALVQAEVEKETPWNTAYSTIAASRKDLLQGIGSGLDLSRDVARYDEIVRNNPDLGLAPSSDILAEESKSTGFLDNVSASFKDAYKRSGMGALQGNLGPQWEEAYQTIYRADPRLLSGGIGSQLDLARDPAKYDEIVKNNPQLGLKTSEEMKQMDLDRLKSEAAVEQQILNNASTTGKIGQLVGAMGGYMTSPIALATLPIGGGSLSLTAGRSIASQLPRILAANAGINFAAVAPSKPLDIKYRREILGEGDITAGQAAKEIVEETVIGAVFGAGLTVGIGAIGRYYNSQARQLGKTTESIIPEEKIVRAERLETEIEMQGGTATKEQAAELQALQTEIIEKTGLPIRQNVKEGGLLPAEEQELRGLLQADKEGTLPPEDIDRLEQLLEMRDEVAYVPTEAAIAADGTPLAPDELVNNPFTANHLREMSELELKSDFGNLTVQEEDRLIQLQELYDIASMRQPGESQLDATMRYAKARERLESGDDAVDDEIAAALGTKVKVNEQQIKLLEPELDPVPMSENVDINSFSADDLKLYDEMQADIINDSKYDTIAIELDDGTTVSARQLAQESAEEMSLLDKVVTCMLNPVQKPKIEKGSR